MDLRSEALALRHPFRVTDPLHAAANGPIGAHGIVGDGTTVALVRVDGAIDWLCWPRFDSAPVFSQLLDAENGGLTSVAPVSRPFESLQRYDPDTAVLETLMSVPEQGSLRLTDYMPWADDPRSAVREIHRRVECVHGEVEVEVVFDPRFDFGRRPHELQVHEHGLFAQSEDGCLALAADGRFEPRPEGGWRRRFKMRQGDRTWVILSWGAEKVEPIKAYRPFELLRNTRRAWRAWAHQLTYDGPWRHLVLRSAMTLKLLQYAPTGALVAAPTTSLPEWIGGVRNWDYRYAWARDAGLSVRAANLIGYGREARDYFHFMRESLVEHDEFHIMLTIEGGLVPEESIVCGVPGYRGTGPVRVGNGAHDQIQVDSAGYVMDAAWVFEHIGGALTLGTWREMTHLIDQVVEQWHKPDHGIWEPRDGICHHVHSKAMSWVCLDRAARMAPLFGDTKMRDQWRSLADEIRQDVLRSGTVQGRYLSRAYGKTAVDAALLLLPIFQFLPPQHGLVAGTVERIQAELVDEGFVRRYGEDLDDGVGGKEGAFIICGFWLAEALAIMGRLEEAIRVFERQISVVNHVGLLAEEVDPGTRAQLGNFPQAFSHVGLISAACRIDLALRQRNEGRVSTPLFQLEL